MAKRIEFWAKKKVNEPIKVKFKDKDGNLIFFRAHKVVKKPVKVIFYKKKK